ncbi:hypothetical protein LMH87_011076 [Akanthomyces muscarius]|uniref:tRNA splicing endonuclease subunit n=1 Tax=Akanthomyces muscarius TaxID=2231603 RepID=A0A9W8UJL9_AKAMU|nr:hypothetical protein LMH87_011076 [Akanthomyces muscarius]KAJ4150322.1 hypothetical protein LMH87_011076 [Akanthomyces muscarius]
MADAAPPDINMTASVAEASRPPPAETPFRPVAAPFPAAPADEPLPDAMAAQPPPPAQSEADRMPPTPVSDEPGAETRPGPIGDRPAALDNEQDSELSDPDSTVRTPPRGTGLREEIVVGAKDNRTPTQADHDGDAAMADADEEPATSHYPKRKRTSIFNDLSESKIEIPTSIRAERPERTALPAASSKPKPRNSLGGVKGVLVGHWRDSQVPQLENKHAVIGFIDVRDRLRTRIQPINKDGEAISYEYPLPPGPGGSWVTFDRIYFSDHLVGLDHFQVKEYVRMRAAAVEDTDEERLAAEAEAVKLATVRGRELLQSENPVVAPLIAHGAIPLDASGNPAAIDTKRRRTSSSFVAIAPQDADAASAAAVATSQHPLALDPLHGTRPTRIVLGFWRGSSEAAPLDRHAVYGILGQNDMFRVKVVRETRDGRYVDGNFPSGAGALWIHYDEVEFEPHIKSLSRPEIKEYCRIRQYQVDHGETVGERRANELRAADEARVRATAYLPTHHLQGATAASKASAASYPHAEADGATADDGGGRASGGHELRQLRRAAADARPARHSLGDIESAGITTTTTTNGGGGSSGSTPHSVQSGEALLERANALARREIARVEAAQGRADRHAVHRERAAQAADAAAATSPPLTNGAASRGLFHESEDIERLNRVWAAQESLRLRGGSEDAKVYDGVKYERKGTGPFMGKLVSQGTIITIDGDDYVEYRVLTKPSFF